MKMKNLIALFTLLALILCGCGNVVADPTENITGPSNDTYIVKFVDEAGNPVPGVVTQYSKKDGNMDLILSEADGTITVQADFFEAKCTILTAPGYTVEDKEHELSADKITIVTLIKQTQEEMNPSYIITVVDQYDKPVPGAVVQVCDDHNCQLPLTTDDHGRATACYAPSNYHVTLNSLPEGYTSEETVFYFEESDNEPIKVTIVVHAGE